MFSKTRQRVAGLVKSLTGRLRSDDAPPSDADKTDTGSPLDNHRFIGNPRTRTDLADNRAKRLVRVAARRTPTRHPTQIGMTETRDEIYHVPIEDDVRVKHRDSEDSSILHEGEKIGLQPIVFALDRSGSFVGETSPLESAEDFVATAALAYQKAGHGENVAITEAYDCGVNAVLPFTDNVDERLDDVLTDGKAHGSSPIADLIEASDSMPGATPETIVVLTHGYPDRPNKMMDAVMEADATVLFIGVDEISFTNDMGIIGTGKHYTTISSDTDVLNALSGFFQR